MTNLSNFWRRFPLLFPSLDEQFATQIIISHHTEVNMDNDYGQRRKKPFRARGSRGGTRKRKEKQLLKTPYTSHNSPHQSHHHRHNHNQASYHQYQNYNHYQGPSMYHVNHQQQQQPHHYANMANFPTIEHTNSSGSSIVSRDENYNPHYVSENMEKQSDAIIPNNMRNSNPSNTLSMNQVSILPPFNKHMKAVDNFPMPDADIMKSLTASTSFSTTASTYANINESGSADDFDIEGELDLFHAMTPLNENADPKSYASMISCAEESFFVTSPKSFLMGPPSRSNIFSS